MWQVAAGVVHLRGLHTSACGQPKCHASVHVSPEGLCRYYGAAAVRPRRIMLRDPGGSSCVSSLEQTPEFCMPIPKGIIGATRHVHSGIASAVDQCIQGRAPSAVPCRANAPRGTASTSTRICRPTRACAGPMLRASVPRAQLAPRSTLLPGCCASCGRLAPCELLIGRWAPST
jgi:hypothetical protein